LDAASRNPKRTIYAPAWRARLDRSRRLGDNPVVSHHLDAVRARARCCASLAVAALLAVGCSGGAPATPRARARAREVTITTVPLLVKEQEAQLPFLRSAFGEGGVLEGREVYAFVPSTIVAVEGDTLKLVLINPEDDAHTLVLPGLRVAVPGERTTRVTYVVPRAGVYSFLCDMPSHAPMMSGQLVVLAPGAVAAGR
jgi:hypothetical protein